MKKRLSNFERRMLKGKIPKRKISIERFKDLIKSLYRRFPDGLYGSQVEDVIILKKVREKLIAENFLIAESHVVKGKESFRYMLGPSALGLVNAWKIESLTWWLVALTITLILLTLALIIIALNQGGILNWF